jgi:hypothetical protein
MIVSGDRVGLRLRLIYAGESRPISDVHREMFQRWRFNMGLPNTVDSLFTTECLFREDTLQVWLPVQEAVRLHLQSEFKAGDELTVLASYVGALKRERSFDWLFVVNEYDASR